MPRLISGSVLRNGGSGEFLNLRGAMPQLTTSTSTTTGFTVFTDNLLRTFYRSSLGNIEMYQGEMWSNLSDGTIRLVGTGTGTIQVIGSVLAESTDTGALIVNGGIGVDGNIWTRDDITVNGVTVGQGFSGFNNIVLYSQESTATSVFTFPNGENNIAIGAEALKNLPLVSKSIAIGRQALSSGTGFIGSIAIGDNSLTRNGYLPPNLIFSISTITVYALSTITGITNDNPVVVTAPDHGLSTGTRVTIQDVDGLDYIGSTGTSTLSFNLVNDQSFYIDVLSTNTFSLYYDNVFTTSTSVNGTTTNWSSYNTSGTVFVPTLVTAPGHDFSTGTSVVIDQVADINGYNEDYNGRIFWVYVLNSSSFYLYTDNILADGHDGSAAAAYVSGGIVHKNFLKNNNIAVGTNAGTSMYDGEQNFFFGDNIAPNMTTGSYNFFMGHDVATFMTTGSGNISIMGDNLVDGKDNQVNIGGVFYYDGDGLLDLNSNVTLGLGTQSTSTDTGALTVFGGVGISHDLRVGGLIYGSIAGASSTSTDAVNILVSNTSTGIFDINFSNPASGQRKVYNTSSLSFDVDNNQLVVEKISVTSTESSTSTTTGQALIVSGGVAVIDSVRSKDGNPDENFLLYSPKVTVSLTPPTTATNKIGDFWVDAGSGITLQWIKDGTSTFWLQVGTI